MSDNLDTEHVAAENGEEIAVQHESNGLLLNQEPGHGVVYHVDSKEDMFVDASDELNTDGREAAVTSEAEEGEEMEKERLVVQVSQFHGMGNGARDDESLDHELKDEEYKEERKSIVREVAGLCKQLKALSRNEVLETEGNAKMDDVPLLEMINGCSQIVKSAWEERLRSESKIRELNEVVFQKDQNIESLSAKVAELLVSNDMASKVQLEKEQHVEAVVDRMLALLAMVVNQDELLDASVSGKIACVEKSTFMVIEKYNQILSEIDKLSRYLSEAVSDARMQEGFGSVFIAAHGELLELKRKEVELVKKISHLEDENRKLVERVEKEKAMVETVNAELGKTRVELEQEKNRCANTKEKLSLAVTKGKALVQQRDSLKQSLADKTNELEKCVIELKEKSSTLEAAELCREELVNCEVLVTSLQETLSQRNAIIKNFDDILSQTSLHEELQSMDIVERLKHLIDERNALQEIIAQKNTVLENFEEISTQTSVPEELQSVGVMEKFKWLVEERNALQDISLEFHKLKHSLSLIDLPKTVSSSDLESQVAWLKGSFLQAKDEINMLQDEIARTRETANYQIDRLSTSLLAEQQEKDYIKIELDELECKYKEIVETAHQVSVQRDHMVQMLLERSGITVDNQEALYRTSYDLTMLIDTCLGKIEEERSASVDTTQVDLELLDGIQSLLYVKDQELKLHEKMLEEEMLLRSMVDNLSNELQLVSQQLVSLKEEKATLQKDLERSEEKSALLREKLSMAVKKGKGLVQDRENLKLLMEDKNSEIEKLKLELQQQESAVVECRDQINRLSAELEQMSKLEADLISMKDQRDKLEHYLSESNYMFQRVIESIDNIILPVSDFEEPVQKVNCLAAYINDCQQAKIHSEQELDKAKDEANTLANKLEEAQGTSKSLDDSLSAAEKHISQLAEERMELEVGKRNAEQELQKAMEEASSQTSKFAEARKSLEDALSLAENNIYVLVNEKEEAQVSRTAAETELVKVREEVDMLTSKVTEAYKTIKSLEDTLSQVEVNVSLLTKQNDDARVARTNLENELKKLKDDAESQSSKLEDASTMVKSLEDALSKAEKDISSLESEKIMAEQEISTLNSKLNAYMNELAGTSGRIESRSLELTGHLNDLQMLIQNERMLFMVKQIFEKKFENLKDIDLILKDIWDHFVEKSSGAVAPVMEEEYVMKPFPQEFDNVNTEVNNGAVNAADGNDISSYFRKTMEEFQLRNKVLAHNFEGFSTFLDEVISVMLRKLKATRDAVIVMTEQMESLKQKMKDMEMYKVEQEKTQTALENDGTILLSACTDATRQLEFEFKNYLLELSSIPELERWKHEFLQEMRKVGDDVAEHQGKLDGNKSVEAAEKLLFAARKVQSWIKLFETTSNIAGTTIEDLQKTLKETRAISEKVTEERDLIQNRVFDLETNVEALQNSCRELRLKVEDYDAIEEKLKKKEADLSLLHDSLLKKQQESEDSLLSASQVKTLIEKISEIEVHVSESEAGDMKPHRSAHLTKLFYIIDSVTGLQHQINILSHDKEELQSIMSTQVLEIEHLKEEIETHIRNNQNSEKMKSELSELTSGLEKVINMLGVSEIAGDKNTSDAKRLLAPLEKHVMALLLEVENSKSKTQELSIKLLGSQKVVDDLSTKVKLLEESLQGKTAQPEIQERSIFEGPLLPTGSEISEVEDAGSLGQSSISPVPSATHVRTLKKGPNDHLALNIDLESDTLIKNEETDEDKGHAFKSLNTSGLIPKQGKQIADRIDGIWVSGGRNLMSRPRARLGVIAYCLLLHIWLLGTIL